MSWTKLACISLLTFPLLACHDDSRSSANADAGETEPDASGDEDASLPEDDADTEDDASAPTGEGPTVMDRCLTSGCGLSHLTPQPDMPFLEDMGNGWKRLMEAEWELAAGTEGYRCLTFTIPEDVYVVSFAPQSPNGTHHATFGISPTAEGPDKLVACGVSTSGTRRLQGSGAGSEPSKLPENVAMPLRKGEQIMMNLHLFNVSKEVLHGRSGMWIKTVPKADVKSEAEAVLAGPLGLSIPSGRSVQRGQCTVRADATIYGVSPHMHQLGVHLRATASTGGAAERMIYDGDYDFSHQLFHDIEDVQVKKGDVVKIECTYANDTNRTVMWGDSSLDEMCFIGLGLYPAINYGANPCFN